MKMKLFLLFLLSIFLFAKQRVITLSPSLNEIVFALGKGNLIVANTRYCNYPKESLDIPKIGGYSSVSLEKLLIAKPSIVLSQAYDKKLLRNLKRLKINTKVFKTSSLEDIKTNIKDLGIYFNAEIKAKKLVSDINKEIKALKNIVTDKKILIVISPNKSLSNQIYISGNYLYFEDIIKASSNKNAYFSTSKAQAIVNTEKIINMNPDIIILLAPFLQNKQKEQDVLRTLWLDLPITASVKKDVYIISKFYAGIPSHRVKYFINDFRGILQNVRNKQLQ